jgi:hypothetical protein
MAKKRVNKIAPPGHPGVRLVKALKTAEPRTKKDGTPFTPWSEEVALRLAKKQEKIEAGEKLPQGKKCSGHTTGVHGPRRPCDRWAVAGLDVCPMHGGSTKAAKAKAKEFLTDQLMPTLNRLIEIRDQDMHMPSALGAAVHITNRILGKPDATEKEKGAGAPIIKIGMALGGLPPGQKQLQVAVQIEPSPVRDDDDEPSREDDEAIDAEFEVENE